MSQQSEQQFAEHTALRGASAPFQDPGDFVSYTDRLRPVSLKVQDPVPKQGVLSHPTHTPVSVELLG